MGIADNTSRGRQLITERPMVLLGLIVGLVVLFDLGNKLMTGQVTASTLVVLVWRGVVNGLVIGLAGVGLSMTYSILNFANFAHGDYITSGAFAGWAATWVVAGLGVADIGSLIVLGAAGDVFSSELQTSVIGAPLAIVIGVVVAGLGAIALALVIDRLVYKPMRNQDGIALLIASIGVAFILRYLLVFVFGTSVRSVAETPPAVSGTFAGVRYSFGYHELTLAICAVGLMLGVHLVLQRTKLGKAMRAMSDNKDLARVTGIPTERVIRWTWVIG
jgi:branched-chain amino acid transport system permease protein